MILGEIHLIIRRKEKKKRKDKSSIPSLSALEENASFVSGYCSNPVWMGKAC